MLSTVNKLFNNIIYPEQKHRLQPAGSLLGQISKLHHRQQPVALIYIDIANFTHMEQIYGSKFCNHVLDMLYESLKNNIKMLLGPNVISVTKLGGDDFCVYLKPPVAWKIPKDLSKTCSRLQQKLEADLRQQLTLKNLLQPVQLHMGFSLITPGNGRSISSKVYSALKEALSSAKRGTSFDYAERLSEFKQILGDNKLRTVYQPIFSLMQGNMYAIEALSRGPKGSRLESPLELFSIAHEAELLFSLEKAARETAILSLPTLPQGTKLFLNIDPQVINDSDFAKGYTRKLLKRKNLNPNDIVFEVTERTAIDDFNVFKKVLHHYREQGFGIAVDDAGSGYSSLQSIAELKPEYIKLDISLIKDIHLDKVKRSLVGTMLSLAEQISAKVIAEGIENASELTALINLGLPYGQGYFLARPANPPLDISAEALHKCKSNGNKNHAKKSPLTLGDIAVANTSIEPTTTTKTAARYFDEHPTANSLVMLENNQPTALLMRDKLNRQLATQYGLSLYWHRPVIHLADEIPLILLSTTPVEDASQLAMNRQAHRLYDEIIVVDENRRYLGNVSIQHLLDIFTQSACLNTKK